MPRLSVKSKHPGLIAVQRFDALWRSVGSLLPDLTVGEVVLLLMH